MLQGVEVILELTADETHRRCLDGNWRVNQHNGLLSPGLFGGEIATRKSAKLDMKTPCQLDISNCSLVLAMPSADKSITKQTL